MHDDLTSGTPADPLKVREFWLDVVRPAYDVGKLEKIPTIKARTPRERAQAATQNHWLTRKSFGCATGAYADGYSRIQWRSTNG